MTREELAKKLRADPELGEQFKFEVEERKAIMDEKEGEFPNVRKLALEATINSWLAKENG
jgi:hypothetical protein